MSSFRALLAVVIVLGALGALATAAGATSGPSPKFCSSYVETTSQLDQLHPTGGKYDLGALKSFGKSLSNLTKSTSGKLKSDVKTMAGFVNALASQGSSLAAEKYLATNTSAVNKYEKATADYVSAGAACASTTTTTTATGSTNFNSCSVVTQDQAASALGQSVTPGVLGNATVEGGRACVFYGPSAPTPTVPDVAQPDSVRVVVVKGSDAMTWYNDYKSKVNAQSIAGYGDQAFYDGAASLSVLKGDSYLRIAVSPAGAPPSLADEKQLATAILPKL